MMREAWRRHRFPLLFMVLVVGVLFLPPLMRGELYTFRDHHDYFQPLRYFTTWHLRSAQLPLWNPYSASGEPWMANPQTGVFYPPTWIFLVFPFAAAYMLYLALHLLILGWGFYALLLRRVSADASLLAAVALMFCGPVLSLLDISNNLATLAWLPWVMWSAGRGPVVAGAFLALAFLGGEPFFAAVGALLYTLMVRDWKPVWMAGLFAFGLSAVQLLPFLEMVRVSDRSAGLPPDQIFRESMALRDWWRVAVPPQLTQSGYDPALSQHFIPVIYMGGLVVILAVLGVISGVQRRTGLLWAGLILAAVLIAGGSNVPVVSEIIARSPVTPFRYPSRVIPLAAMAMAALAGMGWERIGPRPRWMVLLVISVIMADVLLRVGPLLRTERFHTGHVPYDHSIATTSKFLRVARHTTLDRAAWIAGYANLYDKRFDTTTAAPIANDRYMRLHDAAVQTGGFHLLNRLGVGFVLADQRLPQLQPVARTRGVLVHANSHVPPMATLWARVRKAESGAAAASAALQERDWGTLRVSGPLKAELRQQTAAVIGPERISLDSSSARVLIEAPFDGVLVLNQQSAPGWRVFVDGQPREPLLAWGVFRAVELSRGRHEVIWRYRPSSLLMGGIITIITLVSLQVMAIVKRRNRKKFFFLSGEKRVVESPPLPANMLEVESRW